jgi:MFS family permease
MVDRSWQGRALGVMQSAGSTARLIGPLLGGWLLMLDLHKPTTRYGETAFFAAALLCLIGAVLAFCIKKPADDRVPTSIPVGSSV